MTEPWDGRPPGEAAERDGWHWLAVGGKPMLARWAREGLYTHGAWVQITHMTLLRTDGLTYLAPVLLPDEHAAALAAAEMRGREEARALVSQVVAGAHPVWQERGEDGEALSAADILDRLPGLIDEMPAPSGADALAEMLREERRRALREAAEVVDCGCTLAPQVMQAVAAGGTNCAERWRLCPHETCRAIEAAAIHALAQRETPA